MAKSEWGDWIRSNILEIIILILVLVLLIKVFSAPAVAKVAVEEPLTEEATPKIPVEWTPTGEIPFEEEQPLEEGAITEPATAEAQVEETPKE